MLLLINSRLTLLPNHQGFMPCVQLAGLCDLCLCKVWLTIYEVLLPVWHEALNGSLDGEMCARTIGVETHLMKFDFIFGVFLKSLIPSLWQLGNWRIQAIRFDEQFAAFYQRVIQDQAQFGVMTLPRNQRAPHCFEVGSSIGEFHITPEAHYRQIYYGALDPVVGPIRDWFDQPGYNIYWNLEELLL